MNPRRLLVDTYKGPLEMRFSHVIQQPLGDFVVFVADDEEYTVAYYKLVEPTEEEEQMLLDFWADAGEGEGFPIFRVEDE